MDAILAKAASKRCFELYRTLTSVACFVGKRRIPWAATSQLAQRGCPEARPI